MENDQASVEINGAFSFGRYLLIMAALQERLWDKAKIKNQMPSWIRLTS